MAKVMDRYQPTTLDELKIFTINFCSKCSKYKNCEIFRSMSFLNIEADNYPKELVIKKDVGGICTAFEEEKNLLSMEELEKFKDDEKARRHNYKQEKQIAAALEKMDSHNKALVEIKDPTLMLSGTIEIDEQLFKLQKNIKLLVELKLLAGIQATRLEKDYNLLTMSLATEYTKAALAHIGIVPSDKFKFIKTVLAEEYATVQIMKHNHRFFSDMYDSYVEYINIYKKVRVAPDGMV